WRRCSGTRWPAPWPTSSGSRRSGWCTPSSARGRTRWSARTWPWLAGKAPRQEEGVAAVQAGADGLAAAVRTQVVGPVGVITLDDQRRRNAISAWMANGIVTALESLRAQSVRAAVLRAAAGLRVWSAGHDIRELPRGRRDPLAYNDPLGQMLRAIRAFPAPVIAMVHGSVW